MKPALIIICLIGLCACESAVDREQRKLDMMKKAGASASEICSQHRRLVAALLDKGDQTQYELERIGADIDCQTAQLDAQ